MMSRVSRESSATSTDRLQGIAAEHLGYVFSGKMRFVYRDGREEIVGAGEMYFAHPGYAFQVLVDTDTVEFSPSGPYRKHMEAVAARIAAASRGDT